MRCTRDICRGSIWWSAGRTSLWIGGCGLREVRAGGTRGAGNWRASPWGPGRHVRGPLVLEPGPPSEDERRREWWAKGSPQSKEGSSLMLLILLLQGSRDIQANHGGWGCPRNLKGQEYLTAIFQWSRRVSYRHLESSTPVAPSVFSFSLCLISI